MADPDLQIRGGGGGGSHPDPEIRGAVSHFGREIRGGAGPPWPLPWIRHWIPSVTRNETELTSDNYSRRQTLKTRKDGSRPGGGALPYITYTGMCRPTGS